MTLTRREKAILRCPNPAEFHNILRWPFNDPLSAMGRFSKWRSLVDGEEISALPDSVVDQFEKYEPGGSKQLSDNYSTQRGSLSDWEISTTTVIEGDQSLLTDGSAVELYSNSSDGLNYYPTRGDTVDFWLQLESTSARLRVALFAESAGSGSDLRDWDGYAFQLDPSDDLISIDELSNGSSTEIASESNISWVTDSWLACRVTATSDEITFTVSDDEEIGGDTLADLQANDSSHDGSGIGYIADDDGDKFIDDIRAAEDEIIEWPNY